MISVTTQTLLSQNCHFIHHCTVIHVYQTRKVFRLWNLNVDHTAHTKGKSSLVACAFTINMNPCFNKIADKQWKVWETQGVTQTSWVKHQGFIYLISWHCKIWPLLSYYKSIKKSVRNSVCNTNIRGSGAINSNPWLSEIWVLFSLYWIQKKYQDKCEKLSV